MTTKPKIAIYQCWTGNIPTAARYSMTQWKLYCGRFGYDYIFDHNPGWADTKTKYDIYYDRFQVIENDERFDSYDWVIYVDMDIFIRKDVLYIDDKDIFSFLKNNENTHFYICHEKSQRDLRKLYTKGICEKNDKDWLQNNLSLNEYCEICTNYLIFNAGFFIVSRAGRKYAQKYWETFRDYISRNIKNGMSKKDMFYLSDQCYLQVQLYKLNNWTCYTYDRNPDFLSFAHHYWADGDKKTKKEIYSDINEYTKLVHIQLKGADHYAIGTIDRIVNSNSIKDWEHLI